MNTIYLTNEDTTVADVVGGATPNKTKAFIHIFNVQAIYAQNNAVHIVFANSDRITLQYNDYTVVKYVLDDIEKQVQEICADITNCGIDENDEFDFPGVKSKFI